MNCPNCGNNIPGYTKICPICNLDIEEYKEEYEIGDIEDNYAQLKKTMSMTEEERQELLKQELAEYLKGDTVQGIEFAQNDRDTIALGICSVSIGGASLIVGVLTAAAGVILGVIGLVLSINNMKEYNKRCSNTFILSIIGLSLSCLMFFGFITLGCQDGCGYFGMIGEAAGCISQCSSEFGHFFR